MRSTRRTPSVSAAHSRRTLPALATYSRRHIDLQRVATALCPGLANGRSGA